MNKRVRCKSSKDVLVVQRITKIKKSEVLASSDDVLKVLLSSV